VCLKKAQEKFRVWLAIRTYLPIVGG